MAREWQSAIESIRYSEQSGDKTHGSNDIITYNVTIRYDKPIYLFFKQIAVNHSEHCTAILQNVI
jgi:hypothetical protein